MPQLAPIVIIKNDENESQFHFAIDAIELGIWDFNLVTQKYIANDRLKEWYGLQADDEMDASIEIAVIAEMDQQRVTNAMLKALEWEGGDYEIEYTINNPITGEPRIVRAKGKAMFGEDKIAYRFNGTLQDVTEQVMNRRRLEESEKRFQAAISALEGILWTNNANGEMEGEQPGWAKLTGQSFEEYQGYGWAAVIHHEDVEPTITAWKNAVANKTTFKVEHRVKTKKDGWKLFSVKAVPVFDEKGSVQQWVGVHTDVTEQREFVKKIKESEDRFKSLADESPMFVFLIDADPKAPVTYNNKTWLSYTGKTEEEAAGTGWNGIMHPEDVPVALGFYTPALTAKQPYFIPAARILRYDGEYRWHSFKGNPRFLPNGDFNGYVGVGFDIHEQKLAEEKIKESESRFRNMIEQSPVAMLLSKGEDVVIESVNAPMLHFMNKTSANDVLGKTMVEVLPELKGQPALQTVINVQKTGVSFRGNEQPVDIMVNGNLERQYFNFSYDAIKNEGGDYSVLHIAIDVTEQVLNRKKIEESEQDLRNMVMQSPTGICVIDAATLINEIVNVKFVEIAGKPYETIMGKHHWDTFAEAAPYCEIALKGVIENGEPFYANEVELSLLRHGKEETVFLTLRYEPMKDLDGVVKKVVVWVIENTTQVKTRLKVEESESRFRTLAETLPQLVWMTNEEGVYEYASSRWKDYSGLDPHEAETWEKIVYPDDMQVMMKAWTASLQTGEPYHAEARLKNKKGEYCWHFVHGEPVYNEVGKISKWIGSFTNIQDQKTQSEKLEALVSERTKELQRSNEDLQQFAHVASHDLKEPIRKIKMFTHRLEQHLDNKLDETGTGFIKKINGATDRMFTMIEGVLTYSTTNAAKQELQAVDLNEVIINIETDLEVAMQNKSAVIVSQGLPTLKGAPVLLYQLFYNLINNSIKFARKGIPPEINIFSATIHNNDNNFIQITIQDNGIGFEPQFAQHIFETFSRLNSKDDYEGTGLGLSLCKKIVERHGGNIVASGKRGVGSTFIITFPVEQGLINA